jgi:hypothetical protein
MAQENQSGYELWAVWATKCWKCGKSVKVAIDTDGCSFNPFDHYEEPWKGAGDNEDILKSFGVNRELRYSKTAGTTYMANVCPYCGALQGDWFIRDELLEIAYTPPKDFKLFLIKNGSVFDVLSTIEEFKDKYWKFFLYRSLETLGRCEVCRCYISFYPEMFEEYKKYPEAREILEKYGEIRKLVRHHISYKEDKTIDVCSNCHVKIHQSGSSEYIKFRPKD